MTARKNRYGSTLFFLSSVFCLLLILRNTDTALHFMQEGLRLCARALIPSLFPCMVLSELIVSSGGGGILRPLTAPLRRLFRLSDAGCTAVLLGLLCGFPVGTRCAVHALDRGELTREECERVLTFANTPSPAFLIGAVGTSLWGNRRFGTALFLAVLLSALVSGMLFCRIGRPPDSGKRRDDLPPPPALSLPRLLPAAVRAAAEGILPVCGFVVFFSALLGTLSAAAEAFPLPEALRAFLFCLTELSGGMREAVLLPGAESAALLCAFAAGWSGISVHCQVVTAADGRGLSFKPYFLAKALQGVLCVLILALLLRAFPPLSCRAPAREGWMYLF